MKFPDMWTDPIITQKQQKTMGKLKLCWLKYITLKEWKHLNIIYK